MKILVTGANGYIGKGIIQELMIHDVDVIANDMTNSCYGKCVFIDGDIFDVKNPYCYFDKPDILLHLAWKNGFTHNHIGHINDLPKHYSFVKRMIEGGLKQVVVMGSMHEIGYYEGCVCENTPTNPQTLYGIAKDALRRSVELLCIEKKVVFQWLRGFYIVGNFENGNSIFSKIMRAEIAGEKWFPFTSGENQYDFLDYDEFCKQVIAVALQNNVNGIVNICSGKPEKLKDRVERFIRDHGYRIQLEYGKFPDRKYDSKSIWGDNSKIRMILRNM